MARKAVHKNTSPENAGEQNMTPENLSTIRTKYDDLNKKSMNRILAMNRIRQPHKGEWTEEEFMDSVMGFLEYCEDSGLEVCLPALGLWLGCSRTQLYEWRTKPEFGFKHEIIQNLVMVMETHYFQKLDESTNASMFKLKTNGFGYREAQQVDITTNGNDINDSETVKKLVSKMGLDQKTTKVKVKPNLKTD